MRKDEEKEIAIEIRISREELVRGFIVHLVTYIVVNILLIINLKYTPYKIWFIYPLLG